LSFTLTQNVKPLFPPESHISNNPKISPTYQVLSSYIKIPKISLLNQQNRDFLFKFSKSVLSTVSTQTKQRRAKDVNWTIGSRKLTAAKNDDPRMNVRLPAIIILGFV
jgi:hypothetical protein